jgi:hypothetical protein
MLVTEIDWQRFRETAASQIVWVSGEPPAILSITEDGAPRAVLIGWQQFLEMCQAGEIPKEWDEYAVSVAEGPLMRGETKAAP